MVEYITVKDTDYVIRLIPLEYIMSMHIKGGSDNGFVVFKMHSIYGEEFVEVNKVLMDVSPTGESRVSIYYNTVDSKYNCVLPVSLDIETRESGSEHVLEFQKAVSNAPSIAYRIFG